MKKPNLTYLPKILCWKKQCKCWNKRKSREVTGQVNGANPIEGERYYLKLLLNRIKGPTYFQDLLSYNGVQYLSFKEAAQKRGLLEFDDSKTFVESY